LSDEFDRNRELLKQELAHRVPEELAELLEDSTSYGDTFFVPIRARWHESWSYLDEDGKEQQVPAIKHLKANIGEMLNKGQDPNDLALYGQDSNGTVWSICNMNLILHNITRFSIENGDTLEDPQILENGQVRKFDRVLANPPFSQNYNRATLQFPTRFREFCPETGKKADLMFVQHMVASLKPNGHIDGDATWGVVSEW
jgi:hypothetical protein